MDEVRTQRLRSKKVHRIISGRLYSVNLFSRIAPDEDSQTLAELEGLTSARLREERDEIPANSLDGLATGDGASYINAAFAYSSNNSSRFSDGSYGVCYFAFSEHTAIKETVYHREKFLKESNTPPITVEMRELTYRVSGNVFDVRGREDLKKIYSKRSYKASQKFAAKMREKNRDGIIYDSVRDEKGECLVAFKRNIFSGFVPGGYFQYVWDGEKIVNVRSVKEIEL